MMRVVEAAAETGIDRLMFMIGMLEDRFDETVRWTDQLEIVTDLLRTLRPALADAGSVSF